MYKVPKQGSHGVSLPLADVRSYWRIPLAAERIEVRMSFAVAHGGNPEAFKLGDAGLLYCAVAVVRSDWNNNLPWRHNIRNLLKTVAKYHLFLVLNS
jgi:hypothetical protein